MTRTLIINARIITLGKVLTGYALDIQNGRIAGLMPQENAPKDAEIFDAQNAYAAPGLIDMHIHGFGGFGPELGTQEALLNMSVELAKQGVTAFCPTLYCAAPGDMLSVIENTVEAFGQEKGAHILGYHLEGPFISPQKPGVMKPEDISSINIPVLEKLYIAAKGHIATMTAAPELPNIEDLIAFCRARNILLQAGHTNALYAEFLRAAQLGITHATHAFNAMSALNHREPGAAGAILMRPEISTEIIADGVHVHPDLVCFLRRVKPAENLVLVTDALLPTGQKEEPFIANGEAVVFDGGVWKRKADRVIAGSGLTMLKGLQNLTDWGFPLVQAVACATENPARLLGLKNKGKLLPGMDADIVIFDESFRPIKTFIAS